MCAWGMRAGRGELAIFPFLSEILSSSSSLFNFSFFSLFMCVLSSNTLLLPTTMPQCRSETSVLYFRYVRLLLGALFCAVDSLRLSDYFYANAFLAFRSFEFLVLEPDANFVIFRGILNFFRGVWIIFRELLGLFAGFQVFLGFLGFLWFSCGFLIDFF